MRLSKEAPGRRLELPIRVDSYQGRHTPWIEVVHYSVAHMRALSDVFAGNFGRALEQKPWAYFGLVPGCFVKALGDAMQGLAEAALEQEV